MRNDEICNINSLNFSLIKVGMEIINLWAIHTGVKVEQQAIF